MKKLIALLLAFVMVLGMAACGAKQEAAPEAVPEAAPEAVPEAAPEAAPEAVEEEGVLNMLWHQSIGIDTLFESPYHDTQTLWPFMIFDPLFSIDGADGSVVYKLATEHTVSEDGLTYSFTLRDDAKWHDGESVTMDDVLFSLWAGLVDPDAWSTQGTMGRIVGSDEVLSGASNTYSGVTVDGNTIHIQLKAPYGFFMKDLAALYILPEHLLKDVAPTELETCSFWEHPVGSGAYKFNEISFPDYFTLVRNDDYWGEKAGIKNVLFTNYNTGGTDAITAALIAGNLDYAYGNELNDIVLAENIKAQNSDVDYYLSNNNYSRFFVFNEVGGSEGSEQNGVQDARVRRAISMLIDRETIASFYNGQAFPLTTFVSETNEMYNDDIPVFKRDVEGAKELLKEANFDFSKKVRIAYYYDDQTTIDIIDLVCQNLAEAGIQAEPFFVTGDTNAILYEQRNYEMVYQGWGRNDQVQFYTALSPTNARAPLYASSDARQKYFADMLAEYEATSDKAYAKQLADEIQAFEYEQCFAMPIYDLKMVTILNTARVSVPETEMGGSCYPNSKDHAFHLWSLNG